MSSLRAIRKEFTQADWPGVAEQQDFVARAARLGAEISKLLPLLQPEKGVSIERRKARLKAFGDIIARAADPQLFAPMYKAAIQGDDALRRVMIPLLGKCNDPHHHEQVVRQMKSGSGSVRRFSAALLQHAGGRTALGALKVSLGQGGWGDRREAMEVAMELGGHHAIDAVGGVLLRGPTEEKLAALLLLGNQRYVKAALRDARAAILPALDDPSLQVVAAGIAAYGAVAARDEFFEVLSPYLRHADRRLQRTALQAMVGFPGPRTVAELARVWRRADSDVRLAVLGVLRSIGDDDVLPLMVEALGDTTLQVRNAALEATIALGQGGRIDTTRMLLWLLRASDVNVRRLAVDIVREVGDPLGELWPRLLELLRDEDWWVREQVVEALVSMAGEDLTRHVVGYLEDEKDVVRRYAVEVLLRLKDPRSLGALVRVAAADEDWWVRERAVECAGAIGDEKVVPHLVKLAEAEPSLIPSVLTAVRSIGSPRALKFVARVLRHEDADLRCEAVKAAGELDDRRIAGYVEPLLEDADARVRVAARALLSGWNARFASDGDDEAVAQRLHGLERMLWWMTKKGGDDLFLVAGRRPTMKRLGELVPVSERELSAEDVEAVVRSFLTPSQLETFEGLEDVDCSLPIQSLDLRFRVNVYRQATGWAAVFRRIRQEQWDIDDLGLPQLAKELCELPHGLVLIGGPTGSGKSTTLAAMIKHINARFGKHIITIEDPIEVVHEGERARVTQREVGTHTKSFSQALRSTLREDPDVILVGEMRDVQTIGFALTAAETGHLVLATLHTVSADASVDRLIDAFPPGQQQQVRAMLSQTLRAVICQQLLRRTDGEGRVVAAEVMINSDAVANIIRKGRCYQIPSVITTSREMGMQSMDDALLALLDRGLIQPREAYIKGRDKKLFEALLASSTQTGEEPLPAAAPAQLGVQKSRPAAAVPRPGPHIARPHPGRPAPQPAGPGAGSAVPWTDEH